MTSLAAQYNLAILYQEGIQCEKNLELSYYFMRAAAANGDKALMYFKEFYD